MSTIQYSSPTVSIRRVWPKFETREQARENRDHLVRQLRNGDRSAQLFADKLAKCRTHHRCGSSICPICVRALRRWFICRAFACIDELQALNGGGLEGKIVRFSAIPRDEAYRFGDLDGADLQRLNGRLQKQFERAGLPLVFAGVDVSLNLFKNRMDAARWQFHVYGLVIGRTEEAVDEALSALYPPGKRVRSPLHVKPCTGLGAVLSYCIKPYFSRRSGYRDDGTGRRNNRGQPLNGAQAREIAVWFDQFRLADRYVLRGCRKQGDSIVVSPRAKAELLNIAT